MHYLLSMLVLSLLASLLRVLWRKTLGALDRFTDPPIMRERINAGSESYFEWRAEHEGDSELDELFDPGHRQGEDPD